MAVEYQQVPPSRLLQVKISCSSKNVGPSVHVIHAWAHWQTNTMLGSLGDIENKSVHVAGNWTPHNPYHLLSVLVNGTTLPITHPLHPKTYRANITSV